MKCKKCSGENLVMRPNAKNPSATELICADCGTWQKFIGKEEIRLFEIRNQRSAPKPSNADRIRGMSDEGLAAIIAADFTEEKLNYCQNKPECSAILETADGIISDEWCIQCALDWLQQPAKEEV